MLLQNCIPAFSLFLRIADFIVAAHSREPVPSCAANQPKKSCCLTVSERYRDIFCLQGNYPIGTEAEFLSITMIAMLGVFEAWVIRTFPTWGKRRFR
jgi:hypothetical protein